MNGKREDFEMLNEPKTYSLNNFRNIFDLFQIE